MVVLATMHSLFYRLRLEDQLIQAGNGDHKLRKELKRCKAGWKSSEDKKKRLSEANKKVKSDLALVT